MWPFSSYPVTAPHALREEYDYIIIGGGTAGCVLANRLSEDTDYTVLLIERGLASDTWISRVPLFSGPFSPLSRQSFRQNSLADKLLGGRTHELINGNGLGGTSRVNAMQYSRSNAAEYNAWSAEGRKGWSYEDVLPYFKKSQRSLVSNPGSEAGVNGVWKTRIHETVYFEQTTRLFEAGESLGFPYVADANDSSSPAYGATKVHHTLDEKGQRHSTFVAFLPTKLAKERISHLSICTGTIVAKLDIQTGPDGVPRAEGVHLLPVTGRAATKFVRAKCEIIMCAGPFGNPTILQRSGLGSAMLLRELGIPVMKDLPGVGAHLQDHLGVSIVYSVPLKESLVLYQTSPLRFLREAVKYLISGTGIFTCPLVDVSLLARAKHLDSKSHLNVTRTDMDGRNPENVPDIEIMPVAYDSTDEPFDKSLGRFSTLAVLLRPQSVGTVRITSSNPLDPPEIDMGSLSDPSDWDKLRASMRLAMALAKQMHANGYHMGAARVPLSDSDKDLDDHIKRYSRTTYHYSSTCRMAPEHDPRPGVVDDELCVHGVRGLRIADSSIFPQIPSAHLQAPVVMVAEKCADMIKKRL